MATPGLLQRLTSERADLVAESAKLEATATAEARGLTDADKARDDEIFARLTALKGDIDREERRRTLLATAPAVASWAGDGTPLRVENGRAVDSPRIERIHDRALDQRFAFFGEQLVAISKASQPNRYIDPRLLEINAAASGLNESVPSDGGFLVQQDFLPDLLVPMNAQTQIANLCRQVPISANSNGLIANGVDETSRANGSRWGGVLAYWEGEADVVTATKPKFRQIDMKLRKLLAAYYATDEVLEDATALGSLATQAFTEEMAFRVDDSILNGTGVGMPVGIIGHTATVSVAKETGQAAATVNSTNLSKMWARSHPRARKNAVWLYNQDVEPQLDELSIAAGTAALEPRFVNYGPDGVLRIKARPAIAVEQCATLGTVGDIVLADFGWYLKIDKGGIKGAESIHVRFLYDEKVFRFTYRVDGQPVLRSALTPKNGSNTVSPFVTLDTRA